MSLSHPMGFLILRDQTGEAWRPELPFLLKELFVLLPYRDPMLLVRGLSPVVVESIGVSLYFLFYISILTSFEYIDLYVKGD